MPSVNRIAREFKGQGLEVVLVSFREDPELVRRVVRDRGYTVSALLDGSGEVTGKTYGVWAPPTVYLIDRSGRLVARGVGPRDWTSPAARALIGSLL